MARRVEFLTAYQNADYAARYKKLVGKVQAAEAAKAPGKTGLADAIKQITNATANALSLDDAEFQRLIK